MTKRVGIFLFRCTFECLSKKKHCLVKDHCRVSPERAVSKQITSLSRVLSNGYRAQRGSCCLKQDPISIKLVKGRW